MAFQLLYLFTIISFFNNSVGFLLNGTIKAPENGATTLEEKHFRLVMDLVSEERDSNRLLKQQIKQMETFVVGLQRDLQSVKIKLNNCKQNSSITLSEDIEKLKNQTWHLTQKDAQLESSYVLQQNSIKKVEMENGHLLAINKAQEKRINALGNETETLKNDLDLFNNLTSASQFQNSTLLQSLIHYFDAQMQTVQTKVSILSSNANSRSQDFIALLNQTNSAIVKIDKIDRNLLLQDEKTDALEIRQNTTALAMKETWRQIVKLNESVALTVCRRNSSGNFSGGDIIKFNSIKTSQGISETNTVTATGKFTCEKPGLYIFSVFMMSYSQYAEYSLYKNSEIISYVSIAGRPQVTDFHTGSGTVVMQLNVGDTLYVKAVRDMHVYDRYSCFSVIKI